MKKDEEALKDSTPKPHKAPSTPGCQILLDAARAVAFDNPSDDALCMLYGNLLIRKEEHIPSKSLMDIVTAVSAAAAKTCTARWSNVITEFLDAQIGKDGVRKLLEGSRYEIQECGCPGIGYHIIDPTFDIVDAVEELFKNLQVGSITVMMAV